jgi:hypothetical protein
MSMLTINTASLPQASARPAFTKFFAFFSALIEVFAEAQEMARSAQKRYPFVLEG